MAEYIEREKIWPALNVACVPYNRATAKAIESIHAADVRPVVRGKWVKYAPHNSDMMTCSECEKYWLLDGDQYDYHFCPICGAIMEEADGI